MQRIFVTKNDKGFIISENDLYHLKTVLRIKTKDQIECVYEDTIYLCEYIETKDSYSLNILSSKKDNSELDISLDLYQALIRNENFELVIQKATELGVSNIYPTKFIRNVVVLDPKKIDSKIERFNKIASSASMQSHRIKIPKVHNPIDLKDITLENEEIGLVCYEKENNVKSLKEIENKILEAKNIKIIIGPEGGFDKNEYELLLKKGFISISLGKRILRSETASLNILSKLNYIIEKE